MPAEGFAEFCAAQWPRPVGGLGLYCRDRSAAEELAQEALARACADWPRVQRMGSPASWVRTVAFNLARSRFRRLGVARRGQARLAAAARSVQDDPDAAVAVRGALAALPERARAAIVLRYYLDLPTAETARALGLPEGTVKSLVHRGLAQLREALAEPVTHRAEEA